MSTFRVNQSLIINPGFRLYAREGGMKCQRLKALHRNGFSVWFNLSQKLTQF
ncbi:MAG: hypothetical protein F6K36_10825 [Symploca sp. SIO3C6]|nr:hypothetical protein [Symploca sp. SIO3C6]